MPNLIVIAGCNGAGKSTYALSFLPDGLTSFDYDKLYLENYFISPYSLFLFLKSKHPLKYTFRVLDKSWIFDP
jgi:hypothetical protein